MMTELESKLQNYKTARKHLVECFPEREFQGLKMKSAQAEIGDNFKALYHIDLLLKLSFLISYFFFLELLSK